MKAALGADIEHLFRFLAVNCRTAAVAFQPEPFRNPTLGPRPRPSLALCRFGREDSRRLWSLLPCQLSGWSLSTASASCLFADGASRSFGLAREPPPPAPSEVISLPINPAVVPARFVRKRLLGLFSGKALKIPDGCRIVATANHGTPGHNQLSTGMGHRADG